MSGISESAAWCKRHAGKLLAGAALVITPVAVWSAPAGAQVPTCLGLAANIVGTAGHDVLNGTPGNDVIIGLGGDDTINGHGGNDTVCGEDDDLRGGDSDDQMWGDDGSDTFAGGNGIDRCYGGRGRDAADRSCETRSEM